MSNNLTQRLENDKRYYEQLCAPNTPHSTQEAYTRFSQSITQAIDALNHKKELTSQAKLYKNKGEHR